MKHQFCNPARWPMAVRSWSFSAAVLALAQVPCNGILPLHLLSQADSTACVGVSDTSPVCSSSSGRAAKSIDWTEVGVHSDVNDRVEDLAVVEDNAGIRLRCTAQRLAGQSSGEGLWLTSTLSGSPRESFRVLAVELGRSQTGTTFHPQSLTPSIRLEAQGCVDVGGGTARFIRPGLTEEYSVSMDGVRQDFVVMRRPPGAGLLALRLAVSGAKCEAACFGARLVLNESGRRIAYSRLRVTDAANQVLVARIEVPPETPRGGPMLTVIVEDAGAVYPVRIDPTFSDENWVSLGGLPGANGTVRAAVVDGSGNLYIGGDFTAVGNVLANRVAKWNGNNWTALGAGMDGTVYSLVVANGEVYAGGVFTNAGGITANRIAKWSGTEWSALGSGMNSTVYALAISGGNVFAGGNFTDAGGTATHRIARWNGSNWSALGSGLGGTVLALAVSGTNVYAGGTFSTAGGNPASRIARWDGNSWSALGSGVVGFVNALAVSGSNLVAGGTFGTAGGNPASRIARWNGTSWSPLGSGMSSTVYALAASGSNVYAGGTFTNAGGIAANRTARWDGSSWSPLGSGCDDRVNALVVAGDDVYAGGQFNMAGTQPANHISKWNGNDWSPLGSGMNSEVKAMVVSGDDVYAGGAFVSAGSIMANHIAKWNGSGWSALGAGVDGTVFALAVSDGDLYAGGSFTNAGGNPANYVAKWDGSNWSALGSGMNSWVYSLATAGGNVYAGGAFTNAGGTAAGRIARWDGIAWSPLGAGVGGFVYALAVSNNVLYAGGSFTTAGSGAANRVAQWDGNSWSPLDTGMNGSVLALAVSGSDLYAGGIFTTGSVSEVNYVAKWDSGSWTALGVGVNSAVNALAISGSNLYVGGAFTKAGDNPAHSIATWDGTNWSSLGAGVNSAVQALAASDDAIYAGGVFTTAGGQISGYAAKALFVPNTSPTNIILSTSSVAENEPVGTTVGFFSAQDADVGDIHTFTLVSGPGDAHNTNFTIGIGTNLLTATAFDHETQPNQNIRVRATDVAGATYEKAFAITVADVNEVPVANAGGPYTNQLDNSLNLDATGSFDPDAGDILSYAWDLNDDGSFDDATGATPVVSPMALANLGLGLGPQLIRLRVTDPGGLMDTNAASLTLESVPIITAQPLSRTNLVGTFVDFGVAAWGTQPLFYQWWKGTAPLSGETNETYTIPTVSTNDGARYFVVVTNAVGSVTSLVALLTVAVPANLTSRPWLVGADFVAWFTGTPGLTYTIEHTDQLAPPDWQKNVNLTAPTNDLGLGVGVFEFTESVENRAQRFYRTVYPAY